MLIDLQKKLAKTGVRIGANVQKGQFVIISSCCECYEFTRLVVEEAYQAGAAQVTVLWRDDHVARSTYFHASSEVLESVSDWTLMRLKEFKDKKVVRIAIVSDTPGIFVGIDPQKIQNASNALQSKKEAKEYRRFMMAGLVQWTIIAAATKEWAEKVFPDLKGEAAINALWEAIFATSRVTADPVKDWADHNTALAERSRKLNNARFDHLIFTNSVGTNLTVGLADDHWWEGGADQTPEGITYNPNIPTEENFTMPHKDRINGRVHATMPLDYNGYLINDFWLEFQDGVVVDYDAKENKDALKAMLEVDEGAKRLGEVALIPYDSPIQKRKLLFYNTLFDENASCHLALGNSYATNVIGGNQMDQETLKGKGANESMIHVDFMFGSADLDVVGVTKNGQKVPVFHKGKFVL